MGSNRVFLPQDALDRWMSEQRISVDGDIMTLLKEGMRFRLKTAMRFVSEVAGGGDGAQLIGKVKDVDQISALGAEHCADSVVFGESAYQVIEGFVGEPVTTAGARTTGRPGAGKEKNPAELDLLAQLFLSSR